MAKTSTCIQPRTVATALALALALVALPLALASRAEGFVYWANVGAIGTIGRANLDGSGASQSFITDARWPHSVAVDAAHVYWPDGEAIARADLGGTDADRSFITGVAGDTRGIAVDGAHVYWATLGQISRADLDGTDVDEGFIGWPDVNCIWGVAVDARYIYWTDYCAGKIGRANIDGTGIDQGFITGAANPLGVAVDGAHVYWTNNYTQTIGRADLDGGGFDQSFITGANDPVGVAVDAGHLYWVNRAARGIAPSEPLPPETVGAIGRAELDGTNVDQSFITGASYPEGIAVDALVDTTPPTTKITSGAPNKTEKTAVRFRFKSSEPGSTFECKLDKGKWKACKSPKKYRRLKKGKHNFQVRAVDAASNVDPTPAKDKFKVVG